MDDAPKNNRGSERRGAQHRDGCHGLCLCRYSRGGDDPHRAGTFLEQRDHRFFRRNSFNCPVYGNDCVINTWHRSAHDRGLCFDCSACGTGPGTYGRRSIGRPSFLFLFRNYSMRYPTGFNLRLCRSGYCRCRPCQNRL